MFKRALSGPRLALQVAYVVLFYLNLLWLKHAEKCRKNAQFLQFLMSAKNFLTPQMAPFKAKAGNFTIF